MYQPFTGFIPVITPATRWDISLIVREPGNKISARIVAKIICMANLLCIFNSVAFIKFSII